MRQEAVREERAEHEADGHMSASADEDDDEAGPGRGSDRAARPDLAHLRQLSAQLLRCRACGAISLVPVEYLQRLLKTTDAHLLRGRDKVLHRREQVRIWLVGVMPRVVCSSSMRCCMPSLPDALQLVPKTCHGCRHACAQALR